MSTGEAPSDLRILARSRAPAGALTPGRRRPAAAPFGLDLSSLSRLTAARFWFLHFPGQEGPISVRTTTFSLSTRTNTPFVTFRDALIDIESRALPWSPTRAGDTAGRRRLSPETDRSNYWNKDRVWKSLGLLTVVGLTPADWDIEGIDENVART